MRESMGPSGLVTASECLERARRAISETDIEERDGLLGLLAAAERLLPAAPSSDDPPGLTGRDASLVLDLLADPDCRCVLEATSREPRTVPELECDCGIARSTVYRKVGYLTDAGLLEESLRVDGGGPHPSEYRRAVTNVGVSIGPETTVSLGPHPEEARRRQKGPRPPVVPAELFAPSRATDSRPTRND